MSGEEEDVEAYIYNGVDEVPMDVTHVRVEPSVTVIPERAFKDREELIEVELPKGLVTIGDQAFEGCGSLTSVNIPSTVEEIRLEAFYECRKLSGVTLPEGLQRLGEWSFVSCDSLKSINIPPNLKTISQGTFLYCSSLSEVVSSEGIEVIGKDAFSKCKALESVTFPSSLRVIGNESFEGCIRLNEIHMHDAIEIDEMAFWDCNFTNFRIPPRVSHLNINILGSNNSLVSLELPEHVTIEDDVNIVLGSLRNIKLPSDYVVDDTSSLPERFTSLVEAFPDDDNNTPILEALQHRFDDLPIHKICYYQSYHDTEISMQNLRREINPWTSKPPGQLNTTGKELDCLGMTPLHILTCSTKQSIDVYQLLIHKYPETLIMKDKWGDIPLMYAIWCNAPKDILDLLVESYKTCHPEYEFDWSGMLLKLAKAKVSLTNLQRLVNIQTSTFPDQEYDMQGIVMELATYDKSQASLHKPCTSVETFGYLLRVSISKRLDSLGIDRWRVDLENVISTLSGFKARNRDRDTQAVYGKLATYESIKEGTSVLELALWKAKIDESHNKRARINKVGYRDQCRINCRADIVMRNMLPYLLPKLAGEEEES